MFLNSSHDGRLHFDFSNKEQFRLHHNKVDGQRGSVSLFSLKHKRSVRLMPVPAKAIEISGGGVVSCVPQQQRLLQLSACGGNACGTVACFLLSDCSASVSTEQSAASSLSVSASTFRLRLINESEMPLVADSLFHDADIDVHFELVK